MLFSLTYHPHSLWLTFSLHLLLAVVNILTLFSTDWHACLSASCFLSVSVLSLCYAPLNLMLMHLITSRQSGSSWLIRSCGMPERTALYVTQFSVLQSFVGSFQSWALRLMNMYPGLFSQQFWGSLTKRDERALCGCLLDLTVTFLWSLLPLFIFNRLISPGQTRSPFWTLLMSKPTPKILAQTIIFCFSSTCILFES